MFINIKKAGTQYFTSCDECSKDCCSAPKVIFAPLILEDFEYVYKNFLIQFAYIGEELRILMVINDGSSSCVYYVNNRCQIYEQRPPACRMFPISPYFDQFFINTDCEALNTKKQGELICKEDMFNEKFFHPRVDNFIEKLDKTKNFLNTIENSLVPSIVIAGLQLYNYNGDLENTHINMHKKSLKHIKTFSF